MKNKVSLISGFLVLACILTYIFFRNLSSDQFLYIGDQFFRLTYHEVFINSFFIKKIEDLGLLNGWQFVVQFWDTVYYLFVYSLHIPFTIAEKLLFFIVLALSLILSFLGFIKLNTLIHKKENLVVVGAVTLWFCFNPYVVSLWHGGVYNIGSALTYSLAPFILYYYHVSVFTPSSLKQKIICVTLMAIASFTFWLFAPFVFLLFLYSVIYLLLSYRLAPAFLKNILQLLLLYIPLIFFVIFNILYEYFSNAGDQNASFTPTFGNESGGMWYQMLLLFSWAIYNVWTPRSLYSFHEYYFSSTYIRASVSMYVLILIGAVSHFAWLAIKLIPNQKSLLQYLPKDMRTFVRKRTKEARFDIRSKLFIVFSVILFVSLFFAKAAQPPFGEIFLYFYNHVPFFSVFRTADIRFGFSVVLSISLLFLLISRELNKYFLCTVILAILFSQSNFFFDGRAIRGENIEGKFYDRVMSYPPEHKEIITALNRDKSTATYVLPIPAVEYGNYTLQEKDHHFGQDILSKLVHKQFVYLSESKGMSTNAFIALNTSIKKKQFYQLRNFPVKYLLMRRDIACEQCAKLVEAELKNQAKVVVNNRLFTLYELNDYPAIVSSPNSEFQMINPIKYRVRLSHITKPQAVRLLMSFKKDWKIYISKDHQYTCTNDILYKSSRTRECILDMKFFEGEELAYVYRKPLFENTHRIFSGYANEWTIDPVRVRKEYSTDYYTVNKDNSINMDIVIFYKPQAWFYLSLFISTVVATTFLVYLSKQKK